MLAPNTLLHNRYRIVRKLGQGGMGAVYMATDQTFGSTVALKETLIVDELLRKAFEREARLLNSLHHASLPHVFDYFFEGAGQFLVMQFIPGEDLGQYLKRDHRPFPSDQVLKWLDQLLDLLDYLHGHEPPIIHRDIKPENLKLTQRGDIILLDFGLAKGAVDQMTKASSQSLFGYTPHYAPFEQIRGTGTDPRSDLYSLAATTFHLISGQLPPDALTRAESVLNGEPDPLSRLPAMLPMVTPAVASVLHRALAQKRDQRYPTAAAMRADLREAMKSIPSTVKVAPPPVVPYVPTMVEGTSPVNPPGPASHHPPPTSFPPTPPTAFAPSYPSNPQPTLPQHPSNPQQQQQTQPIYPSDPPTQQPYPHQMHPSASFPPTPPTVHGAQGAPSQVPARSGNAKIIITLAVAAVFLVALAAVAIILLVPGIIDNGPANGNRVANTNTTNAANSNKGPDAGPVAKTLTPLGVLNAPSTVLAVAVDADGEFVASSADENAIRLWQAGSGSLVRELRGQQKASRGLDYSHDGAYVASGCDDGTVRIWKADDGTEVRSFKAHDSYVFLLAFSPDGSKLMTASGDKTVKVWRSTDGSLVKVVNAPGDGDNIVNVSPDLRYVAFYGADKGVVVWAVENDRRVATLKNHTYDLKAGAFSPDGTTLALGSTDGVVRVWSTSDGTLLREMKSTGGSVNRVRWSSDGSLLASGSSDGSIRLWSARDGAKLSEVMGHTSPVNSIAFSADGRTLVTGSSDKTIHVWGVSDKKS